MSANINPNSVTTILTDLTDVLIGGVIGLDDVIESKYGKKR